MSINVRSLAGVDNDGNGLNSEDPNGRLFDHVTYFVTPQNDFPKLTNVVLMKQFPETTPREAIFSAAGRDLFQRDFDYLRSEYQGQLMFVPHFSGTDEEVQAGLYSPAMMFPKPQTVVMATRTTVCRLIDNRDVPSSGKKLASEIDFNCDLHVLLLDGERVPASSPFSDWLEFFQFDARDVESLAQIERLEVRLKLNDMRPFSIDVLLKPGFEVDGFELEALSTPDLQDNIQKLISGLRPTIGLDELTACRQLVGPVIDDAQIRSNGRRLAISIGDHDALRQVVSKLNGIMSARADDAD